MKYKFFKVYGETHSLWAIEILSGVLDQLLEFLTSGKKVWQTNHGYIRNLQAFLNKISGELLKISLKNFPADVNIFCMYWAKF